MISGRKAAFGGIMQLYEYKVVPAPQKGEKTRGARTTPERFAAALMTVMNAMGREGWDYVRADTLPCEERVGLTGRSSSFQHMLVFRRPIQASAAALPDTTAPAPPPAPVVALHPEGAAPRITPFARPVVVPTSAAHAPLGPARGSTPPAGD
jgi:hypothetical protein